MKKYMKKTAALLLVILMLGATLSACIDFKLPEWLSGNGDDATTPPNTTDAPDNRIPLIEAGKKTDYVIVYPDDASDELILLVEYLADEMNIAFPDINIEATPAYADWGDASVVPKEILIGGTGREESMDAELLLDSKEEYIIKLYDSGKLVLMAKTEKALLASINYLINEYVSSELGFFGVEEGLEYKDAVSASKRTGWLLASVPSYWGGKLSSNVYAIGYGLKNSYSGNMQVISETNANEYTTYINQLKEEGYRTVSTTSIGKNRYGQYKNGSSLVYVYYTDSVGEVRVISDTASVTETEFEYSYTPLASDTSTFYQYALMYDPTGAGGTPDGVTKFYENNGLFNVIKLADDSVILMDGGWDVQATDDAVAALMQFLRDVTNTPTGKVRIAAVFLTHSHNDHIHMVKQLVTQYSNEIIIERVMHNLYSTSISTNFTTFFSLARKNNPNIQFIKLHTGQNIQLANVTFDVLYTHEDRVSADGISEVLNDNNTSTMLKMTMNGKTFMLTGDWGGSHTISESDGTMQEYRDMEAALLADFAPSDGENFLKCDVLQISHHGINYWLDEFYKMVDPDVVFFPQQDVAYSKLAHSCYQNIVNEMRNLGISDSNMHFAGRYTYGLNVAKDGTTSLYYRPIEGADDNYYSLISRYSPFHSVWGALI